MPIRGIREVYYCLLIGVMTAGDATALEPEDLKKLNSVGHCVECDLTDANFSELFDRSFIKR